MDAYLNEIEGLDNRTIEKNGIAMSGPLRNRCARDTSHPVRLSRRVEDRCVQIDD